MVSIVLNVKTKLLVLVWSPMFSHLNKDFRQTCYSKEMPPKFKTIEVKDLFRDKKVVFLGDSIIRDIYKGSILSNCMS